MGRGVGGEWGVEGGCSVASAPQTAPPGKLRLVHKHDLTVSHSPFSPRHPHPPTSVTTLITVIPPASFPLSPCVYPFTPSSPHPSTFRSKCLSIRKDAETTTPLSLYPFIHQRCADEVGEKKKKKTHPHTVEKFSFASDSPLTSLTPVIVYILTPLAWRGKVPKTSWSHHIGKILTYVSLITYTPLLLFPFHSRLFLHPNCPCLGCC